MLLLYPAAAARAETLADVFTGLATDLGSGAAELVVKRFDRRMPDYAALEGNIYGLAARDDVASSIRIVREEGGATVRTVTLDWILELTPKEPANPGERRHQTVTAKLELRGKKWAITSIEPVNFFAPSRTK